VLVLVLVVVVGVASVPVKAVSRLAAVEVVGCLLGMFPQCRPLQPSPQ
jgi:hypothetical protein